MIEILKGLGLTLFENIAKTGDIDLTGIKTGDVCFLKIGAMNVNAGLPFKGMGDTSDCVVIGGADGKSVAFKLEPNSSEPSVIEHEKLPFRTGTHYIFSEEDPSFLEKETIRLTDQTLLCVCDITRSPFEFESLDPFKRTVALKFSRQRPAEIQLIDEPKQRIVRGSAVTGESEWTLKKVIQGEPVSVVAASPTVVTFIGDIFDSIWHLRRIHTKHATEDYLLVVKKSEVNAEVEN